MFSNFSLPELLIVAALALIVIGPKDLPRMMRSVGKFVGQVRGMARQFQRSMDDAAREMDVQEFRDAQSLMNRKTSAKALEKKLGLDDLDEDEDAPASPGKPGTQRVMTSAEVEERAKSFTTPKPAAPKPASPASDPAPSAPPAPETAEMEPLAKTGSGQG